MIEVDELLTWLHGKIDPRDSRTANPRQVDLSTAQGP